MEGWIVAGVVAVVVIIIIAKTAVVVPQQKVFVVERLGKYHATLTAGFHILLPFLDSIAYKHSLKERAVDIPEQICITRDNVQVGVDGVLYLKVMDPKRASYGVTDYLFAITQLAQTTLRSEIGKIDLDRTFEERTAINIAVVSELDKASDPWGMKVLRYEIKNINPPRDVLAAMEKQMRAEREKRAVILGSEGERDAKINEAEGDNLKARLTALKAKVVLPKDLFTAMTELRLLGNDDAHVRATDYSDVGKGEVDIAIRLTREYLKAPHQPQDPGIAREGWRKPGAPGGQGRSSASCRNRRWGPWFRPPSPSTPRFGNWC